MSETLLLIVCMYVVIGMINAIKAFDDDILMIRHHATVEAVVEALLYVLLWPVQVAWVVLMWLMIERKEEPND